jgi:hypothetical protein
MNTYPKILICKFSLLTLLVLSCEDKEVCSEQQHGVNSTIEIYRVKIQQYEALKYKALHENDSKSANMLANHFSFTEPNKKLADFWLAITARNGSKDAAEIFTRRGSSYSQYLEENPANKVLHEMLSLPNQ